MGEVMGVHCETMPAQLSRKLQAYAFICDYILEMGFSPAMGEIAAALGVSDTRAKALVKILTVEKRVFRTPGAQRAIIVPGLLEQHVLNKLRAGGAIVNEDWLNLKQPLPLPQGNLPLVAIIEHIPDVADEDPHAAEIDERESRAA
ncbi:SOS-response transcriptional repressor LexA [Sphingomonas sp. JUb134]|nr:SOS-response transcriptional repressor LexA [Sphingomonas sp. JUb134]